MHITDTHLDETYVEGAKAECAQPLCCRRENGMAGKGEKAAGKYGTLGWCDSNKLLIETLLENIRDNHEDIPYVIWTGDSPSHKIWNQTKDDEKRATRRINHLLR